MCFIYHLTKEEAKDLEDIKNKYYMGPILKRIDEELMQKKPHEWKYIFNKINQILFSSETEVKGIVKKRKEDGKIHDEQQAIKNLAGHAFPYCLIYLFLKNKIVGNIKPHIYITSKKSRVKGFDKIATINIGNDTQKPDVDLIIYTLQKNKVNQCIILSLKTSLRERAGQTYRWKLLMEIAITDNPMREKYNISYDVSNMPLIFFVTANFYNEINNPQHKGMIKFFDKAFIAKEIEKNDFISPLSDLVDFVNEKLS